MSEADGLTFWWRGRWRGKKAQLRKTSRRCAVCYEVLGPGRLERNFCSQKCMSYHDDHDRRLIHLAPGVVDKVADLVHGVGISPYGMIETLINTYDEDAPP